MLGDLLEQAVSKCEQLTLYKVNVAVKATMTRGRLIREFLARLLTGRQIWLGKTEERHQTPL